MNQKFLNELDDCDWLRTTHLNHTLHEFRSFLLFGNGDSPTGADLYKAADPTVYDEYWEVRVGPDGEWAWTFVDGVEAQKRWEQANVDY